jgi:hypothetical protein
MQYVDFDFILHRCFWAWYLVWFDCSLTSFFLLVLGLRVHFQIFHCKFSYSVSVTKPEPRCIYRCSYTGLGYPMVEIGSI